MVGKEWRKQLVAFNPDQGIYTGDFTSGDWADVARWRAERRGPPGPGPGPSAPSRGAVLGGSVLALAIGAVFLIAGLTGWAEVPIEDYVIGAPIFLIGLVCFAVGLAMQS